MLNDNKLGVNDSNIQTGINNNSLTLINADTVRELGNQVARLGVYIEGGVKNTVIKFINKIQNFNQEKFSQTLKKSDTFLRIIDDAKFASTETMQEIRARILAQEYNHPNSISMRSWEEMRKISAAEFKYFEENIAPYCSEDACFILPKSNIETLKTAIDIGFFRTVQSYDFSGDIQKKEYRYIEYNHFYNKSKVRLLRTYLERLQFKVLSLTQFGVDLCKICEPRPWDLAVINEAKIELEKLGLTYNQDFVFLNENNQNILQ